MPQPEVTPDVTYFHKKIFRWVKGYLSAIVVANLSAAKLRARIARTQADMVTLARSIEHFRLDKGVLLVDSSGFNTEIGRKRVREQFLSVGYSVGQRTFIDILAPLTSPISYLSVIPKDSFRELAIRYRDPDEWPSQENMLVANPFAWSTFYCQVLDPEIDRISSNRNRSRLREYSTPTFNLGDFYLTGKGPDRAGGGPLAFSRIPYNVSNGLYSVGGFQYHSRSGFPQGVLIERGR